MALFSFGLAGQIDDLIKILKKEIKAWREIGNEDILQSSMVTEEEEIIKKAI